MRQNILFIVLISSIGQILGDCPKDTRGCGCFCIGNDQPCLGQCVKSDQYACGDSCIPESDVCYQFDSQNYCSENYVLCDDSQTKDNKMMVCKDKTSFWACQDTQKCTDITKPCTIDTEDKCPASKPNLFTSTDGKTKECYDPKEKYECNNALVLIDAPCDGKCNNGKLMVCKIGGNDKCLSSDEYIECGKKQTCKCTAAAEPGDTCVMKSKVHCDSCSPLAEPCKKDDSCADGYFRCEESKGKFICASIKEMFKCKKDEKCKKLDTDTCDAENPDLEFCVDDDMQNIPCKINGKWSCSNKKYSCNGECKAMDTESCPADGKITCNGLECKDPAKESEIKCLSDSETLRKCSDGTCLNKDTPCPNDKECPANNFNCACTNLFNPSDEVCQSVDSPCGGTCKNESLIICGSKCQSGGEKCNGECSNGYWFCDKSDKCIQNHEMCETNCRKGYCALGNVCKYGDDCDSFEDAKDSASGVSITTFTIIVSSVITKLIFY